MSGINSLAYYEKLLNYSLKSFITIAPGANDIKLFVSVIYEFSYYAKMFVRIGWKRL
jgi:hypothetical protein